MAEWLERLLWELQTCSSTFICRQNMKYNKPQTKTQNDSGHSNDFKIGIRSFPAGRSALKGQCGEKPASLLVCRWERHLAGFPHLGVVKR